MKWNALTKVLRYGGWGVLCSCQGVTNTGYQPQGEVSAKAQARKIIFIMTRRRRVHSTIDTADIHLARVPLLLKQRLLNWIVMSRRRSTFSATISNRSPMSGAARSARDTSLNQNILDLAQYMSRLHGKA